MKSDAAFALVSHIRLLISTGQHGWCLLHLTEKLYTLTCQTFEELVKSCRSTKDRRDVWTQRKKHSNHPIVSNTEPGIKKTNVANIEKRCHSE